MNNSINTDNSFALYQSTPIPQQDTPQEAIPQNDPQQENDNTLQNTDLSVAINDTEESLGLYNYQGIVPEANQTNNDSKGSFISDGGAVVVNVLNSESGYDNLIYWSSDNFKTRHYIGIDDNTTSVNIGTFAAGTKIDFGIDNQNGGFYRTGDASLNTDNYQHAQIQESSNGTQIGFEDLDGGGDNDFNDAIINVMNLAPAAQESRSTSSEHSARGEYHLNEGGSPFAGARKATNPRVRDVREAFKQAIMEATIESLHPAIQNTEIDKGKAEALTQTNAPTKKRFMADDVTPSSIEAKLLSVILKARIEKNTHHSHRSKDPAD